MNSQIATESAAPTAGEAEWFTRFLQNSVDTIAVIDYLARLAQDCFFAADEVAYAALAPGLNEKSVGGRLVLQRFLPLVLSKDLAVRRVVVLDTVDEEAARAGIEQALIKAEFPHSIVESIELVTFFADVLPAMIAHCPVKQLTFRPPSAEEPVHYYAIVSTPRAGSTFLGDLLHSIGLGNPIEHIRPWLIELVAARPAGLFDTIRFVQRLVAFGRSGSVFGTKLISHMLTELRGSLRPTELSYARELAGRATIIYLNRRNKLDQAISSLRARKTGIWHSTDRAYRQAQAAQQYGAFEYDFDEIANTLSYYVTGERRLAALLADHPDLIVVDYDELIAAPGRICREVADRLGMPVRTDPTAKVEKLADQASQALARRFLAEAEERGLAITQLLDAEELLDEARRQKAEQVAEAERIRNGHARHRQGPYQDRHYHLIDYDCAEIPGLSGMWRGPMPKSFEPGQYVLFLGAAQTFGAYVARPFPTQVGEQLGVDILNLSRGGVSPLFFSENPRIRQLIAGARAVVMHAISARMIPTSRFTSIDHMNLMCMRDDSDNRVVDSEVVWQNVLKTEPADNLRALVREARDAWVRSMQSIAECATGRTLLLWFSERKPQYDFRSDSLFGIFSKFPQLIDQETVYAAKEHYGEYVEIVTQWEGGESTQSTFSKVILPVIFGGGRLEEQQLQTINTYYPTQRMHDKVANALYPKLVDV